MTKQDLKDFFAQRPALSIAQVAAEAGYSPISNYLSKVLSSPGDELPTILISNLTPVLVKYGYLVGSDIKKFQS